ncbi:uroporphyrinogen-III C-methyltransferase [Luteimonas suaedae]|uniref:uroporphyrinogen-III C-methyltransferase n=1 Tax=Luteimonas suaedae TaxID=2605430 RepID=UPI0011EDF0D0|nr:uroporphyrinogen-III C-methyltransferase [Luteimonas suaedae]
MNDAPEPTPKPSAPRTRGGGLAWWLVLVLVLGGGWAGWRWWTAQEDARRAGADDTLQRLAALEARSDRVRGELRAQSQRLQQAESTNRVLRDELLGIGQRAAILEENLENKLAALADPPRSGARALRLDEIALLLGQGQQRLQLAGDLDGARRAYALAAQQLAELEDADPALVDLRQTLAQERAALEALGDDPRRVAAGRLDALTAALAALPVQAPADAADAATWWQRAFVRLVDVRRSDDVLAVEPADRAAGLAALQLELTLAQAAIERRDEAGLRAALARADTWLTRLWPDSPALRTQRAKLKALRQLPLSPALPTLGSSLEQLRTLRARR